MSFIRGLPISGAGAGFIDGFTGTPGSVLFVGADTKIAQDNANLFYDDTNNRFCVGTNSSVGRVTIAGVTGTTREQGITYTGGALTSISGAELIDVQLLPASVQFSSGTTLALQRSSYIQGSTYSATSAKTITQAATLYLTPPVAGTNVTFGTGTDYFTGNFALVSGPAHFQQSNAGAITGPSSAKKPPALISFCTENLTGISTSYEFRYFSGNMGQSLEWTGAPPSTWRGAVFDGNTTLQSTTGGQTVTEGITLYVGPGPVGSANVTLTRSWGAWIDGQTRVNFNLNGTIPGSGITVTNTNTAGEQGFACTDDAGVTFRFICFNSTYATFATQGAIIKPNSRDFIFRRSGTATDGIWNGDGTFQWGASNVFKVGTAGQLGFFGTAVQTKQTVTGSRGGNAALASLLTALATYGFITDSSS